VLRKKTGSAHPTNSGFSKTREWPEVENVIGPAFDDVKRLGLHIGTGMVTSAKAGSFSEFPDLQTNPSSSSCQNCVEQVQFSFSDSVSIESGASNRAGVVAAIIDIHDSLLVATDPSDVIENTTPPSALIWN
jgi:hypothetical protein